MFREFSVKRLSIVKTFDGQLGEEKIVSIYLITKKAAQRKNYVLICKKWIPLV